MPARARDACDVLCENNPREAEVVYNMRVMNLVDTIERGSERGTDGNFND